MREKCVDDFLGVRIVVLDSRGAVLPKVNQPATIATNFIWLLSVEQAMPVVLAPPVPPGPTIRMRILNLRVKLWRAKKFRGYSSAGRASRSQ